MAPLGMPAQGQTSRSHYTTPSSQTSHVHHTTLHTLYLLTNITRSPHHAPLPHPVHPHKHHTFTTPHPPPLHIHNTKPSSTPCTSSQTSHSYTMPSPIHCTSLQTCSLHHALLYTLYLLTNTTIPRPPPYPLPPHKHVHYTMPSSIHCTSSHVTCLFNAHLPI